MEKYVGLDVSMEETSVCVLDGGGNIVFEGKTSSQPDALSKLLRAKASDAARIVLETGSLASWLWHELRGRNFPVICLDARHVRAALSMRVNKTDRNDARGLAELARMGWYREANVKSMESQYNIRCWRRAPSWSTFDEMSRTRCAVCSRVSASPRQSRNQSAARKDRSDHARSTTSAHAVQSDDACAFGIGHPGGVLRCPDPQARQRR